MDENTCNMTCSILASFYTFILFLQQNSSFHLLFPKFDFPVRLFCHGSVCCFALLKISKIYVQWGFENCYTGIPIIFLQGCRPTMYCININGKVDLAAFELLFSNSDQRLLSDFLRYMFITSNYSVDKLKVLVQVELLCLDQKLLSQFFKYIHIT